MIHWPAPVASVPVRGSVVVPGSKSASARSLLLAALATGPSVLTGVLASRDTALMQRGLTTLGAGFTDLPDGRLQVRPATTIRGGGTIDCGLAGTVMRFLPPVAALASPATAFIGDAAAGTRPVAGLLGALAGLGASVSEPHRLPFTVGGSPAFRGGAVAIDASASSQFISALLLAGARFPEGVEVTHTGSTLPSAPHIEMTVALLTRRGVLVDRPAEHTWRVQPGPIAGLDEVVEPDLTNAATLLAAALATGGELSTAWPGDSVQAADQLAGVLAAFGAKISYSTAGPRRITVSGSAGVRGADVDLGAVSELTPVAAALAALADGPSVIRGVAHIRGHETDRLAALAAELAGLGAAVSQTADGLLITPGRLHAGTFHTYADHRLAHAGALLGLVTPGVELDDVGCTTKTLPDFPGLWARLLGAGS
ncbi:MAG: 3-phosphoshikimate 1-carboxyvinyltransferase [Propionibacteriaceae bacterium]|nr:3-phosphoshikimate 1-carboxyvinyltransferase [Propionibacteriaceae bacterium]